MISRRRHSCSPEVSSLKSGLDVHAYICITNKSRWNTLICRPKRQFFFTIMRDELPKCFVVQIVDSVSDYQIKAKYRLNPPHSKPLPELTVIRQNGSSMRTSRVIPSIELARTFSPGLNGRLTGPTVRQIPGTDTAYRALLQTILSREIPADGSF